MRMRQDIHRLRRRVPTEFDLAMMSLFRIEEDIQDVLRGETRVTVKIESEGTILHFNTNQWVGLSHDEREEVWHRIIDRLTRTPMIQSALEAQLAHEGGNEE